MFQTVNGKHMMYGFLVSFVMYFLCMAIQTDLFVVSLHHWVGSIMSEILVYIGVVLFMLQIAGRSHLDGKHTNNVTLHL